jgi:hypothetical protein
MAADKVGFWRNVHYHISNILFYNVFALPEKEPAKRVKRLIVIFIVLGFGFG